jgi:hypothetical protein
VDEKIETCDKPVRQTPSNLRVFLISQSPHWGPRLPKDQIQVRTGTSTAKETPTPMLAIVFLNPSSVREIGRLPREYLEADEIAEFAARGTALPGG